MRRNLIFLIRVIALAALCLMHSGSAECSPGPEEDPQTMLLLDEKDNGRTVDIRQGESVQVRLSENATSGYRWAIERCDEEFLQALAAEPRYAADAIGSGGEITFIFQGKKTGETEVVLKHWRQWEGDSSVISSFRIRLHIKP